VRRDLRQLRVNPTTAPWATETNLARARELWAAGVRVVDIGRAVGTTSDAIAGYAHRHGWGPHPNQPPGGRKAGSPNKPPLEAPQKPVRRRSPPRAVPKPPAPVAAPVAPQWVPPPRTCQWSDSWRRPWVFCGCPTVKGGSWCAEHSARAWVRPPRRLEAGL
jgi:hypothetical protein